MIGTTTASKLRAVQTFWITTTAVVWGIGAGLLIPRASYRLSVPPGEPWRSACPAGHPLTGIGNGWLGRAYCSEGDRYGPNTPILTAVTAAACTVLAAAVGARPELVVWLLLVPAGVLLAAVDSKVHRLPDIVTVPFTAITLVLLGGAALLPHADGSWTTALLGSLTLAACYLLLFLINPKGIGFGDVKLAPALGAALGWYGWKIILLGTFTGYLFGALYGAGLILARRAARTSAIPLGPFLMAGALTGILLGTHTI
ncbi:A24 family peptidase [Streptomyces sp. NPDC004658]|uniref:prepilin peptidase n=1 Tax=Streptomyces sp. NPDC004658 TaxID=3154672 RepID=UPI00339E6BE4